MRNLFAVLCIFLSSLCLSQTYTTIGVNTWSTDGSTDCSCSPGVGDDMVFNHYADMSSGTYTGDITINSGGEFNLFGTMTLGPTGTITFNDGELDVFGSFRNDGTVTGNGTFAGGGSAVNYGTWPDVGHGDNIPRGDVLPIELIYFRGTVTDFGVRLTWATASEVNNDFFTIERSTSLEDFEIVGTLPGAGMSSSILTYSFLDSEITNEGVVYYRLKQTDYNGDYEYSDIIAVNMNGGLDIYVYPTVSAGVFYVNGYNGFNITITDIQGNIVNVDTSLSLIHI